MNARTLESFYTEIRRCRARCDGNPFVEHRTEDEHDCEKAKCQPHKCKPLGASTVRQIHSIISGTLSLAQRWDWIDTNPAKVARRPKPKRVFEVNRAWLVVRPPGRSRSVTGGVG
jgi:integrase